MPGGEGMTSAGGATAVAYGNREATLILTGYDNKLSAFLLTAGLGGAAGVGCICGG